MPDYPVPYPDWHDVARPSGFRTQVRESSGPTVLEVGAVADGEYLKRDGDTIVGAGGGGVGSSVDETELAFTDVVTANSSSTKHGLLKKLSNVATEVLDGQGAWRAIATILGFTPADDAAVVHDTGDETVAGVKTFSSDPIIPDEAYGVGWNGSLEPPTKNAVYDKVETLGAAGIGGSTGATDNAILRADGAGGATLQNSTVTIDDTGNITTPNATTVTADSARIGDGAADTYATFWNSAVDPTNAFALLQGVDANTVINSASITDFRLGNGFSPNAGRLTSDGLTLGVALITPKVNFNTTVTPSGSADSQGSVGDMRYDDNFIYIKTSAGWKRSALSTF